MLREMNCDWKYTKTYATEANLRKAIAEISENSSDHNDRYMVVRTPEGRWTAIVVLDKSQGGYLFRTPFMMV